MDSTRRFIQFVSILLLAAAPWPFGMVQDGWRFALESCCFLLLGAWFAAGGLLRRVTVLKTGLAWPAAALLAYLVLTVVPLPAELAGLLSPRAAELYEAAFAAGNAEPGNSAALSRLSLAPYDTVRESLRIAACVFFFFLALHAWRHRRGFVAAYHAIIANGVLLALFGIIQSLWSNGRIYWRFESGSGTPFGPFVNHNHFAGYLELTLGLTLGMLVAEVRKPHAVGGSGGPGWFERLSHPESGKLWYLLVAAFVMAVALAASLSRGGVVSVAAAAMLFTLVLLAARWRRNRAVPTRSGHGAGLAAASLVTIALVALFLGSSPWARDRWRIVTDSAAQYRLQLWRDTLRAVGDFPLTGSGAGSFATVYPAYKNRVFLSQETHAENEYLQWLVESGAIGFALLGVSGLVLAAGILTRLAKRRDPEVRALGGGALFGLTSLSIHNLLDFNSHIPSNALTFVAVAVLALLTASWRKSPQGDSYLFAGEHRVLGRAAGVIFACLSLGAATGLSLFSFAVYRSGRITLEWETENPVPSASALPSNPAEDLGAALRWFPWNDRACALAAAYHASSARAAGVFRPVERDSSLDEARREAQAALRLRPASGRYWAQLGEVAALQRDATTANAAFRRAESLARSDGAVYVAHGYALLALGDPAGAAGRFRTARTYDPTLAVSGLLAALVTQTPDPAVWEQVVRNEPADLADYAAFLDRRGLVSQAEDIRARARSLRSTGGPARKLNPRELSEPAR